ncbi:hypothetical protein [Weissella muntiaci]|nr:hypothetical protein [Weissella muntiaci]
MTMDQMAKKISKLNSSTLDMYQAFYNLAMIDEMPTSISEVVATKYNDQAFLDIGSAILLLKNELNQLISTFNLYHLVDIEGNKASGLNFWLPNKIGIEELSGEYEAQLKQIEDAINKMNEIMILSGLLERK